MVEHGILYQSVKLVVGDVVQVLVIPNALIVVVVQAAHVSGHGSWQTMYTSIRRQCYFPGIATACTNFVEQCARCKAADPIAGPSVPPTRADVPGRPWGEVVLDTLELGLDRSGHYHCVLVAVDSFTKWVEVTPLRRHDALSVAAAFSEMCTRWGAPDVVRVDNGTEFANAIVESLFQLFGIRVRSGAVRHPQSQGSAERLFNRTLLGLIRKCLDESEAWKEELGILMYHYRNRPHAATGLTPMEAMPGWQPRS